LAINPQGSSSDSKQSLAKDAKERKGGPLKAISGADGQASKYQPYIFPFASLGDLCAMIFGFG